MACKSKLMTADELLRLPDDHKRHELVRGELRTRDLAGWEHGTITMTVGGLLHDHARAGDLGALVAAAGFILERDPDTVRAPDISFVSALRVGGQVPIGYYPGAPDLAVEVLCPDDTYDEVDDKIDDLLRCGCGTVWVVNPRRHTITVHRPDSPPALLNENDILEGGDVIPGFKCRVGEAFA